MPRQDNVTIAVGATIGFRRVAHPLRSGGWGRDDRLDDGDFYYYDGHRVIAQYKTKPPPTDRPLLPFNKAVDNTDASFSPEPRALARAEADTPVIAVADKNNATTKTSTVNHQFIQGGSTPPSNTARAHQYYVYGLDYIDEIVGYYDTDNTGALINDPKYVLQDVNYNVTAITHSTMLLHWLTLRYRIFPCRISSARRRRCQFLIQGVVV